MSQITTHILDTSRGRPAADVSVLLAQHTEYGWQDMAQGSTNEDGRVPDLLPVDLVLPAGSYKLVFNTGDYFARRETAAFYPFVEICFRVTSSEHYHVPLLLNPFGYSTYRGS